MARRAVTRSRVTPRKLNTNWGRTVPTTHTTIAFGAKALIASVALSNVGINEVVRRTRGVLGVYSDQSAAMEEQIGALGFIVVTDLAAAAGAASIPGPVTDANDDGWFVWMPFTQQCAVTVGGSAVNSNPPGNWHFDSKAMRRVEEGFVVAIMVENGGGANGMDVTLLTSLLASRI